MADEPALSEDTQRELAARRKDLDREFDDKARELKAQHKRQMDRLQQDRVDWEEHKRTQAKELADREEKVNRREANKERATETKAGDHKQMDDLRRRVRELEERGLDAKTATARLEERLAKSVKAQSGAQNLLTAFVGVCLVYGLAWFIIALQGDDRTSLVLAALFLLVVGFLSFLRLRLRPGRPTRT